MKMKNKEKIVFKNDIDELLNNKLMGMWNMERRDYYKLEAEDSNMFKGYGDKSGVMYLGDVDYDHYMDINVFNTGIVRMGFRYNDDYIIKMNSDKFDKDIDSIVSIFLESINNYMKLLASFEELRNGVIPTSMRRDMQLNNILESESL